MAPYRLRQPSARVSLAEGDTVIFSSKIIPGNERTIADLHNRLLRRGIEVITEKDADVHVSGHPCRGELRQMYQWIRPQIAVPVHGEARHMQAHGALARANSRCRSRCSSRTATCCGLRPARPPSSATRTAGQARARRRADRRDRSRLDQRAAQADAQWRDLRLGHRRPQRPDPRIAHRLRAAGFWTRMTSRRSGRPLRRDVADAVDCASTRARHATRVPSRRRRGALSGVRCAKATASAR